MAEVPIEVRRCPVHGIPDCSPLLNGCSIPRYRVEAYEMARAEDAAGLAAAWALGEEWVGFDESHHYGDRLLTALPPRDPSAQPPPCPDHHEVQHRDRKPPWCNACGWRHGVPAKPAQRLGTPR